MGRLITALFKFMAMNSKIKRAIQIISKFHGPVNAKKTGYDCMFFLYELTPASINSEKIQKAVAKAEKQPDYPTGVKYNNGLLAFVDGVNQAILEQKKEQKKEQEEEQEKEQEKDADVKVKKTSKKKI